MKRIGLLTISLLFFIQLITAQTPEQLKAWLPEAEGWAISEQVEVFDSDNLFDRINGAAPLYIENNFREMTSLEYKKGDDYITVQAYRHASPEDAFGMYAAERSSDLKFHPVGGEAQGGNESFFFFAGNMYVKMQANSQEDLTNTLLQIGKGLAGKIDPNASYPEILKHFPEENKVSYSESYITSSYIGHDFLKSVYVVKYNNNKQPFQLFVVDGKTTEGAKGILQDYFTFISQKIAFSEGELLIEDKYNGNIPVVWKGQYIVGVFNENGEDVENGSHWLKELLRNL